MVDELVPRPAVRSRQAADGIRRSAPRLEGAGAAERLKLDFPAGADDPHTLDTLVGLGFKRPLEASATVRRWLAGGYPALRGEFAKNHFAELLPVLIEHFAHGESPDRTLIAFDRFLSAVHGGGRLFSLLLRNPDLVALLALVLGTAPRLADIVAHNPQVMDALIDPAFFGAPAPFASLKEAARALIPYIERELSHGSKLSSITRHVLGLFRAVPGARAFRRPLATEAVKAGADARVLDDALALVLDTSANMSHIAA